MTEDGLDLLCVVPTNEKVFKTPVENVEGMPYDTFLYGLVCCHSLTIIDNQIVGDPLDLKASASTIIYECFFISDLFQMFESTKWVMDEFDVADNNKFDMLFPTVLKPPKNRAPANQNLTEEPQIGE